MPRGRLTIGSMTNLGGRTNTLEASTSLALFFDDIELLLRDLYGDFDQSAASAVRYALYTVLCGCLRSLPKDIWKEHWDATTIDHGWYGVGLDPGDGISTYSVRQADEAANDLARRIRAFRANPKAYSKYTHQFVHILDERWPKFDVQDHHFWQGVTRFGFQSM